MLELATTEDPDEPLRNVIALSLACILELFVIVTGEYICRPPFAFIVPLFVIVAEVDVLLKLIEIALPVEFIIPLFIILFTNTFEILRPIVFAGLMVTPELIVISPPVAVTVDDVFEEITC
jgi:hypothetical protein